MDDIFYLSDGKLSIAGLYVLAEQFFVSAENKLLLMAKDESAFQIRLGDLIFLDVSELDDGLVRAEAEKCNNGNPVFCFSFHRDDLKRLSMFLRFVLDSAGGKFGVDDDEFEPSFGKEELPNLLSCLGS